MKPKPISYESAVKFEHSMRGSYGDLSYRPTFRASAIFFVLVNKRINTLISFLNYWREKNHNSLVSALITIRDSQGQKIRRDFISLQDFVYQFNVRELISPQTDFTGSLEVELFSNQDLKYAFPAIDAFYESPDGVSFVHSNQRIYNDIEDMDRSSKMNEWQTGFDIYAQDKQSGYLTIINGQRSVHKAKIELQIFNSGGKKLKRTVMLGELPAYASCMVMLKDVPGVKKFLRNDVGFCKVNMNAFGVFMRIACGNILTDNSRMTATHSYYDCTDHGEYYKESDTPPEELACFTPINLIDGLETELVFYPTYTKSTLIFSLDCFSKNGSLHKSIENIGKLKSPSSNMLRLNIREILRGNNISEGAGVYCLVIKSSDGKIPARMAYGLNYYKTGIGCNINHSIWMNQSYGKRKRIFVWGAGIHKDGSKNWILISHFSKVKGFKEKAEIMVKIYAKNGVIGEKTYTTQNPTALNISIEELISKSAYKPGQDEVLWYTAESSCPNYVSSQINISKAGFVGGCHSF